MSDTTYLELVEGVGVKPSHLRQPDGSEVENPKAGEPAELKHIGVQVPMPTKVEDGEILMVTQSVGIEPHPSLKDAGAVESRIIPGTRVVETKSPAVVNLLLETGHYQPCDPPRSEQPRKPRQSEEVQS